MLTQSIVLEVIKIRSLISIIAGAAMLGACSSPVQTESPIESKRASLLRMPEVHGNAIIELNYTKLDSGGNVIIRFFESDGDGKHDMIGYYLNCDPRFGYSSSNIKNEKLFGVIQNRNLFEDRYAPYGYDDDNKPKVLGEEIPLIDPPICNEDI